MSIITASSPTHPLQQSTHSNPNTTIHPSKTSPKNHIRYAFLIRLLRCCSCSTHPCSSSSYPWARGWHLGGGKWRSPSDVLKLEPHAIDDRLWYWLTSQAEILEARADTVTCKPDKNASKNKKWNVDVSYAKAQANKGGFKAGKSGYPHEYQGKDDIKWDVKECDADKAPLYEYPVFWVGSKGSNGQLEWLKDTKKSDDKQKPTPLRVVYVNNNGGTKYCGVMTHTEVDKDNHGKDRFKKCWSTRSAGTSSCLFTVDLT